MKLNGHNPVDLIINHRKLIEKIFTVLVLLSLICAPMVGINYDLTKYLPDSSPSAQALDIMEDEFTYPGMGRVMLKDVTLYEAKNIKDRIADVDRRRHGHVGRPYDQHLRFERIHRLR